MLQKLTISNYVIIDYLEINFSESLNVITGETGAGKSILIDALSLALGQRADVKIWPDPEKKCVIEAHFSIGHYLLQDFFEKHELDYDELLIIRREISESGRSRCFVNDTPVTVSLLKELGEQLVNLHSQHETLSLNNSNFQLQLVDYLAGHESLLNEYANWYRTYKTEEKKLYELLSLTHSASYDREYLAFQWKELQDARLQPGEQEQLEHELRILDHATEIKGCLENALSILHSSDYAVLEQLPRLTEWLRHIVKFMPEANELLQRTESAYLELRDIADTVEKLSEEIVVDEERCTYIQQRLDMLYRLHKKHKTTEIAQLIAIQHSLKETLHSIEQQEELADQIRKKLSGLSEKLLSLADQIHINRKAAGQQLTHQVKELLREVGMPEALFVAEIQKQDLSHLTIHGIDYIQFLFSANKGIAPDELRKVASGGELSRLMLVLKSIAASHTNLPTLIFDEIDAGISGETANKVGRLLEQLAQRHQVIVITHLPQIASKGNCHFYVYKDNRGEKSIARVRKLEEEERVEEIAKLLSGEKVTDHALNSARELLYH